mgnify:CR=1 FL=1
MKVEVKTLDAAGNGDVELNDAVFGVEPRADILHRVVTWQLGNLGEGEGSMVHVTVELGAPGIYTNDATLTYRAGVNLLTLDSNQTKTAYGVDPTTGEAATGEPTSGTGTDGTGGTGGGTGGAGTGSGAGETGVPTTSGGPTTGSGTDGTGAGGTASDTVGETDDGGCGCRSPGRSPLDLTLLIGVAALVRRRRAA